MKRISYFHVLCDIKGLYIKAFKLPTVFKAPLPEHQFYLTNIKFYIFQAFTEDLHACLAGK